MIIVTLVHGTWGRGFFGQKEDADWATAESALCESLSAKFGDDIEIRRFRWSGGNTHTARIKASLKLREVLAKQIDQCPEHKHFLVAHSHGGNVVLSAITDDLKDKVEGIVCLATPFISAKKRDLGSGSMFSIACSIVALLGYLAFTIIGQFETESWPWLKTLFLWVGIFVCLLTPLVAFKELVILAKEFANKMNDELKIALPDSQKLLIIRSPGDEAIVAIAFFQFLSLVSIRLFFIANSLLVPIKKWVDRNTDSKRKLFVALGLSFLLIVGLGLFGTKLAPEPGFLKTLISGLAFVLLIFATLVFIALVPTLGAKGIVFIPQLIVSLLLWPVMIVLCLFFIPFGWQAAVANLFLDISVESTPDGSWQIHSMSPPMSKKLEVSSASEKLEVSSPSMKHGVYENPNVITKLTEWIDELNG